MAGGNLFSSLALSQTTVSEGEKTTGERELDNASIDISMLVLGFPNLDVAHLSSHHNKMTSDMPGSGSGGGAGGVHVDVFRTMS